MTQVATALACLSFMLYASAVHAGIVQIFKQDGSSDRSGWEAAVGNNFSLETFDDATLVPGLSLTGPNVNITGGHFTDDVDGAMTTTIEFVPNVLAAGGFFDLDPATAGTGLDLHFEFAGGGSEIVEVRSVSDAQGFTGFIGIIADTPIARIVISEGDQTSLGTHEIYYGDDLVFSNVPEPSSFTLFAVAIVLVGGKAFSSTRRRRS
ncbi:MAG: PEP-CTERM sorting domain-containing protein [Pirellulales bacterium]